LPSITEPVNASPSQTTRSEIQATALKFVIRILERLEGTPETRTVGSNELNAFTEALIKVISFARILPPSDVVDVIALVRVMLPIHLWNEFLISNIDDDPIKRLQELKHFLSKKICDNEVALFEAFTPLATNELLGSANIEGNDGMSFSPVTVSATIDPLLLHCPQTEGYKNGNTSPDDSFGINETEALNQVSKIDQPNKSLLVFDVCPVASANGSQSKPLLSALFNHLIFSLIFSFSCRHCGLLQGYNRQCLRRFTNQTNGHKRTANQSFSRPR